MFKSIGCLKLLIWPTICHYWGARYCWRAKCSHFQIIFNTNCQITMTAQVLLYHLIQSVFLCNIHRTYHDIPCVTGYTAIWFYITCCQPMIKYTSIISVHPYFAINCLVLYKFVFLLHYVIISTMTNAEGSFICFMKTV